MELIVHTDGASRGNPGHAAAGFIISDSTGKIIAQSGKFLGTTTNNQAEYHAVLLALNWIDKNLNLVGFAPKQLSKLANLRLRLLPSEATPSTIYNVRVGDGEGANFANEIAGAGQIQITFFLDSELVVRQLSGQYKIKSQELLPLAIKIKNLQNSLNSQNTRIAFRSVPRSLNKPADRLVNQILDSASQ